MAIAGSFTFCFLGKPKKVDIDDEDTPEAGDSKPDPIKDIKDTFHMMIKPKMLLC